ncbi:MAG: AAA family ATPase [Phycisphaerae bacterium]
MLTIPTPPIGSLPALTPAQRETLSCITNGLTRGPCVSVWGNPGSGVTTILQHAHASLGGAFLHAQHLFPCCTTNPPPHHAIANLLLDSLQSTDLLIIDDFDLALQTAKTVTRHEYGRDPVIALLEERLFAFLRSARKRLLLGRVGDSAFSPHTFFWKIPPFKAPDYAALCANLLGPELAASLDFHHIHRFAPKLTAHQLHKACLWLAHEPSLTTDRFIDYLKSQQLTSNVDADNLPPIDFSDLKGMDDLLLSLETNLICPLENASLAGELHARPKRGILLAGPPGTGKTSIGRALAHRLKSKFFLIDGTFLSGTAGFYRAVDNIFEAAAQNAPALIFIDDTDVIFEDGSETRFYRYLLTKLDGLESADAGLVCIAMTAMNVASLPPALIRSGRIELWLQTRLPDEPGRTAILQSLAKNAPSPFTDIHFNRLAAATDGFSGADLKRLIEDAKLLYAFDKSRSNHLREPTNYLLDAIDVVRENKRLHAQAEAAARRRRPHRPPYFDVNDDADGDAP